MNETDALKALAAQYERLKADKQMRNAYWERVLEYTVPHKAAVVNEFTLASRPHREKYDSSGMLNAARCAAGMYTHLCPPGRWLLLTPQPGSEAAEDPSYAESLASQTEKLHQSFELTNFETEIHSAFEDLMGGTCCVAIKKKELQPFTLSTRPLNEYAFACDDEGMPTTTFIERNLSAYEAANLFGIDKLPTAVQDPLRKMHDAAYTERRSYLHVTRPNEEWDPRAIRGRQPYESIWMDLEKKQKIRRDGVRRQRYIISRFWRATGLDWGMGPSDMAYPTIRCLDKISEIALKYAAKAMDPPSVWPDDGAFHPMSTAPGARIIGRMGATDRGNPQYLQLNSDHRIAEWLFNYYSNLLAQIFFANIFQTLEQNRQKTAYEVATALQKDYDLAIPVFARQKRELFAPLVRVCLELLTEYQLGIYGWQYGGETLPDYEYQLELISPLALAIKFQELRKLPNLVALLNPLAEMKPEVWDNYNLDEISLAIGEYMGVPEKWKRSLYERRQLRQMRAEALAEQRALQQLQQGADVADKLNQPAQENSLLQQVA
jgi:hypothetical protein